MGRSSPLICQSAANAAVHDVLIVLCDTAERQTDSVLVELSTSAITKTHSCANGERTHR